MPSGVYKRKPLTPEHRANISAALTGGKNHMFGKKHTPESRSKMSVSHTGRKPSTETREKMSEAQKGVSKSPEHCAALSKASKGVPKSSDVQLAANKSLGDMMRGGHDIVYHHMIYDHSDLSKNIMKMTRSMHQKLHKLFQKYEIIIPHINVKEA